MKADSKTKILFTILGVAIGFGVASLFIKQKIWNTFVAKIRSFLKPKFNV